MTPLYIIIGMLVPAILVVMVLYHRKTFKMTSIAIGRVASVQERVVRDEHARREETIVVAQFTVNRRDYQIESVFRGKQAGRFPIGRELTIRYNPADPSMARVA